MARVGHFSNPSPALLFLFKRMDGKHDDHYRVDPAGEESLFPRSRQVQRRLKPDQIDELVERYKAGETAEVLAAKFGINRDTVFQHLKRRGAPRRQRRLNRQADIDKAVSLYEAGLTLAAIGREFRVDPKAVRRTLLKNGLILRKRAAPTHQKMSPRHD